MVTVTAGETITIALAEYRASQTRWRVSGSDSVAANQLLLITYANGTRKDGSSLNGFAIGNAFVDAAGAWAFDLRGATGALDPTSSNFGVRPTQIRVTSPLGGTRTANFTVR
jgi:hypothetical protein